MKTAFIDRDGTIIDNAGYVNTVEQMLAKRFVPGALEGMRRLRNLGYQIVIVSNQGGVGAGFLTEATLREINAALLGRLAEHGLYVRNFRYCPHHPEAKCGCRKPLPGMLQLAAAEDDATLCESIMIGDQDCDVVAGAAANVKLCFRVSPEGWGDLDATLAGVYGRV